MYISTRSYILLLLGFHPPSTVLQHTSAVGLKKKRINRKYISSGLPQCNRYARYKYMRVLCAEASCISIAETIVLFFLIYKYILYCFSCFNIIYVYCVFSARHRTPDRARESSTPAQRTRDIWNFNFPRRRRPLLRSCRRRGTLPDDNISLRALTFRSQGRSKQLPGSAHFSAARGDK